MQASAAEALSLYAFEPPYTKPRRIGSERLPRLLPRGTIILLRPSPVAGWVRMERALDFAAAAANAAVVLWADQLPAETLAEMAGRARLRCVGAIAGQVPELSLLRAHLTQPDGWPDCVVAWTRRRYGDLQHDVAKVLRVAAQRALTDRTVTRVVAMSGSKPWTVYRRFSASGIGPPAAWFQAIRATAMAMAIQREIELPIQRFAVRFGYAASDSLSRRLWRILGVRPRSIRTALGWEWLLLEAILRSRDILNPAGI